MFNIFTSEGSRYNDYAEGFGNLWESRDTLDSRAQNTAANGNNPNAVYIERITGIFGNSYQTVIFKPLLGILYQKKYLQLRFMGGLTIELSSVDDPLGPIVSNFAAYYAGL